MTMSDALILGILTLIVNAVLAIFGGWLAYKMKALGVGQLAVVATQAVIAGKVEEIHKATNSMKDELVAVTRKDALAEGHLAGVAETVATVAAVDTQRATPT